MSTPLVPPLCPICRAVWDRWLDAGPALMHQRRGLGIHRVGDHNVRQVLDTQRLAWEDVRRTIRDQQRMISEACARDHLRS